MTITYDPTPPLPAVCRLIPKVPDENQPPPSGAPNWCAPVAAANIVEFWELVMKHPEAKGVMDSWTAAQVGDEIGWFMNTNNTGSPNRSNPVPHTGTFNADIEPGLDEFVQWDATSTFGHVLPPATKSGYKWSYKTDYAQNFAFHKSEIDNGRPAIVAFLYWNPIREPLPPVKDASGEDLFVYTWGQVTQSSNDPVEEWNFQEDRLNIGHVVTGVGYWENFDPDGPAGRIQPSTWAIVHDNWRSTARNVAIPWQSWVATVSVKVPPPTAVPEVPEVVAEFALLQNYPNPFNPSTMISFSVKSPAFVEVALFDVTGHEVRTLAHDFYPAGRHQIRFDATGLATGVYLYRLRAGAFEAVRKLVVLR